MESAHTGGAHEEPDADRSFERQLLEVLAALSNGAFSVRMPAGRGGLQGEIAHTLNAHLDQLTKFEWETTRVVRELGLEGRLGAQASTAGLSGAWRSMAEALNATSTILSTQLRECIRVVQAYAAGDLSQRMTVETHGELAEMTTALNTLAEQLQELKAAVEKLVAQQRTRGG